jgi:hypothetical protein
MQALNRYISSILHTLNWRHFGVGALQAYLSENGVFEQRLHIWHPSLVAEGIRGAGDMHNHRFSFTSRVLGGCLTNTHYLIHDNPEGNWDMYSVQNARDAYFKKGGKYECNTDLIGRVHVTESITESYCRDDEYFFRRGDYHITTFDGCTVTLVTKFDQSSDTRARIVVPHGRELIHAFDESREYDLDLILSEARDELC